MSALTDQQKKQVLNVSQTLLEAFEHLHTLIKAKEFNQSVFALSSIAEGLEAIRGTIAELKIPALTEQTNKLEQQVLEITHLLQAGNLTTINSNLQFITLPLMKKFHASLQEEIGNTSQPGKPYAIGVFHQHRNPLNFYTKERIQAMVQESEKQNTELYFFTSTDVDFAERTISADFCQNGTWQRIPIPFPDVINNVGTGRRTHAERKLRRMIPFTTFHVENKLFLPKRMVEHRKYAELLVPFHLCRSTKGIHDFINNHTKVVFKALGSNRGENIFFVTKTGNRYNLQAHKKEQILGADAFDQWLENVILKRSGSFIVQRYIHTRTKDDEPYHIRAHVQKDGDGKWVLTHIYPRIGNKRSHLSNVATDGRVEDFHTFLQEQYGQIGATYEQDILQLSLDVTRHLDKLYNLALSDLGLDFAIDENGRYWMHEANNGPQTAFHEEQRAVNTIAYAKYIAENGIVRSGTGIKGSQPFQARNANLPFVQETHQPTMGLLTGKVVYDDLVKSFIKKAEDKGVTIFSFTPADIDAEEMVIRGSFYENETWVPRIIGYPDVIMDRLNLRGNANWIYEELEEASLFTNEWPEKRHTRSEIYKQLQIASEEDRLAPWQSVNKTRDIFRFIEEYGSVLVKPEQGPARANTQFINRQSNGQYVFTQGNTSKSYNEMPLRHKLNERLKEQRLVVQQDTRSRIAEGIPFTIYTHALFLNGDWQVIDSFAEASERIVLNDFLAQQYDTETAQHLQQQIEKMTTQTAELLRQVYGEIITELSCDISIDLENDLHLLDVKPNGPEIIFDAETVAEALLTYEANIEVERS